ncbi:MAG: aspartate/glutamate racemase family protein, partial [Pseudomonadota bacterium]|nr:aspartate/glutamate racemase family protein [Pseudomonadota bacterium]
MSQGINRPVNESAPYGGKTVYGATLGILMLETEFPRVHGDVGNAATFDFPVLYKVVPGATSYRVVREQGAGLDDAFADAARELVQIGADGVGTSCGFLSLFQSKLAAAAGVPVATSSLMQVPWVQRTLPPGKRVGVITISSGNLTPAHFEAVGAPLDTPMIGTEGGTEFTKSITGGSHTLDVEASRDDIVAAGQELIRRHPEIGAVVLEC